MLATKNPNEAEAASAARRVCKLLAEVNCEFEINVPDSPRDITYNDVTRSTEPWFRSRRPTTPGEPINWTKTRNPDEGFREGTWSDTEKVRREAAEAARKAEQEQQEAARKEQEERTQREGYKYYDFVDIPNFDDILRDIFTNSPFAEPRKRERRTLQCKTCKESFPTVFIGAPELYECNNCQWTAYQRNKPPTNP